MDLAKKAENVDVPFIERRRDAETQRLAQSLIASQHATIAERDMALQKAEVMMEEIGHRVRNSLNAVSSLLQLQAMLTSTEDVRAELLTAAGRIAAVGRVQQHLSHKVLEESMSVTKYLNLLCNDLTNILGLPVALAVEDVAETCFHTEAMVSLGLMVNEMVTNATKYGATVVSVTFIKCLDGQLELSVADNGFGLQDNFDLKSSPGLGMKVIATSASHLGGTLTHRSSTEGAIFAVKFPATLIHPPG